MEEMHYMLSKEQIFSYIQQGQPQSNWLILRPKTSYLIKQAIIYAILAVVVMLLGAYFLSQNSYVFTPYYSGTLDAGAFQTWRFIDEAALAIFLLLFVFAALKNLLDLNTIQKQLLVLMPEGFLLKKRNTEQYVAYAGVTTLSARASRYGDVTLQIKAVGSDAIYKVHLDNRYGNARMLASQIVSAQRQYATSQRAGVAQR
jgi:hypothetical protein